MIKRLRQTKYIEEILGFLGILYLVGLLAISFFAVRFLVANTLASYTPAQLTKTPPATFQIEEATKALLR